MPDPVGIDALNRDCRCISIDRDELARQFTQAGMASGLQAELIQKNPHLFASVPVYMARQHVRRMQDIVSAIEEVVSHPAYQEAALAEAPELARHATPARGVFYGYDFHLGHDGPQLIEINTNAGGALLNVLLARAQKACCRETESLTVGPVELQTLEQVFVEMFQSEWRAVHKERPLKRVAIVDDAPTGQFLYPEFVLFQTLFERAGIAASIAAPEELTYEGDVLLHAGHPVDLVYNRVVDFYLEEPLHAALRAAYLGGHVVLTPHPRAHALYASKQNLVRLSDSAFLDTLGIGQPTRDLLLSGIPKAIRVAKQDAETLWRDRKRYFFKPYAGYGSKAAYRGDKLTKGVFAEILERDYIAQFVVPPSERHIELDGASIPLKLDVRNYVYDAHVQFLAARLYHGQTTNFRTAGGGFAPVFTEAV